MMRKKKGSIISLLIALVFFALICSAAPAIALADPGENGTTGIWRWTELPGGTLSVTGCTYAITDVVSLTLPESLDTGSGTPLPITRIENNAFDKYYGLKSIDMSGCSSLTSIGDYAFRGNSNLYPCSYLETVIMPDSVTSVGKDVFYFCDNLTSVTLSNNLQNIGDSMFYNCRKLTSITIPGSVTSIGLNAFKGSGLTSITIPDSVTIIGDAAFANCSSLVSVTLPDNVGFTRIPNDLFFDAFKLTTTNISELSHVTSIGDNAFLHTAVTSISIPNSVTTIGNCAFQYCTSLESVTLPTNPGFIGIPDYAFYGCTALTSVTIPESVTSIGERAFEGCSALEEINVDAANTHFSGLDGVLFNYDKTRLICHPAGRSGSFDIPASVTNIDDYAFAGSSCLTGVSIPDSVASIGDYAFFNCNNTALTEITIPGSVAGIGNYAFDGCSALEQITIEEGVKSIGDYTFDNCSGLSEISMPKSITSIGGYAFFGCGSLTEITVSEGVNSIGDYAFGFCLSLKKAVILSCSTSFGSNVFKFTTITSGGIYGLVGSDAQDYAETNSIPFHIIHVVSFNSGGGSAVSDIVATSGGTITAPSNPTRPGFDFNGWYKDAECTTAWDFNNDTVTENITLYAKWSQSVSTYALTITAGTGGSITTGSSGNYAEGAVINIAAAASADYSFNKWTSTGGGSFADASSATTTFTMPAGATTITASFTHNGGSSSGGGSGGGSSSTSTTTTQTYSASVLGGTTENTLPVTVNTDAGSAGVYLETPAGDLFTGQGTVINMPSIPGVNAYTLGIPAASLSASQGQGALTFSTGAGSITLPDNMLAGNTGVEGQSAGITIGRADKSGLPDEVQAAIGDRPLVQLTLTVDGEQRSWNNPDAPVTVSLPYTPTAAELADPEHIVVWYIDGSGNAVPVPSGRYDPATGTVTFTTTHFSHYAVVYVKKTFTDLGSAAWAQKTIEALASKGILTGISEKEYAPQANITRADFLCFLVRTLGLSARVDGNFDDIDRNAPYYQEIGIAKKLGITSGTGNNKFGPGAGITRQDMMTLTERALRMLDKLEVQGDSSDLDKFADKSLIAAYAANSVSTMVKEGLIVGSGGKINPLGNTTRAEAAAFLYRIYNKY